MSFLPPSPTLMNQAPLIADFTLSGPIVGPYRRGSDSSGQTLEEEEGGGQEGVGSISSKKTCQQNKILTNDRKDREIPPPFPSQTPGEPSVVGRRRHHLSRLAFFTMSPPEKPTCAHGPCVSPYLDTEEQVHFSASAGVRQNRSQPPKRASHPGTRVCWGAAVLLFAPP